MTVYRQWFNIGVGECDDGWIALVGTRGDGDAVT